MLSRVQAAAVAVLGLCAAAASAEASIEREHEALVAKYSSGADPVSFLQTQAQVGRAQGGCEVCVYVVENKQQHQPYLCRGLRDPAYQQSVRSRSRPHPRAAAPPPRPKGENTVPHTCCTRRGARSVPWCSSA